MRNPQQVSRGDGLLRGCWLAIAAVALALTGCSPGAGGDPTALVIAIADARIEEPVDALPEEWCPIHPTEESSDSGCCGCHSYAVPYECDPGCQPDPDPEPCTTDPTTGDLIACRDAGVIYADSNTYYRIGSGTDPGAHEYEFVDGQSGENGTIRRDGGTEKKGVSFFSTLKDAEAARDRIGSKAKIHKVSSFPPDLHFVGKQPPPNHFHLVPNKHGMTLKEYREALRKVKLTKYEP